MVNPDCVKIHETIFNAFSDNKLKMYNNYDSKNPTKNILIKQILL